MFDSIEKSSVKANKSKRQSFRNNAKNKEVVQRFYENYYPDYPDEHITKTRRNIQAVNEYVDSLDRPAWFSGTREAVLNNTNTFRHTEPRRSLFTGKIELYPVITFECASCLSFKPYDSIQIGHIMKWRDYLKMVGVKNWEEASIAYNELSNLHVQCCGCNSSHDFEFNSDDEEGFLN